MVFTTTQSIRVVNRTNNSTKAQVISSLNMLHSAAPSSFNMFPFSQPPQHPGPAPPSHHGDMFHPPPSSHHHTQHHQQTEVVSRPKFLFKMPRVVPNQKEKFETDEFMKRHSREGEVSKMTQSYILHVCPGKCNVRVWRFLC